jgi:rod shape-determining protein MreC
VLRLTAPVKAAAQRLALPFLVLLSGVLILLGKADILLFDHVRVSLADAAAPVLQLVGQPVSTVASEVERVEDLVDVYRRNTQLREENARLLRWQEVARRLAAENAELRQLTKLAPEDTSSYVAGRVIADSGGAFVRNVLVNAGSHDGVARGQAALSGEGLVGRVAEVGERAARILLLTDLNSRVPVMLERSNDRAVLAGDNTDRPRLLYLQPKAAVEVGDRVVSAGAGGIFPPGLPVGVVASTADGVARVEPFVELSRLDFVRIVDFGLGGVLPQPVQPIVRGRGKKEAAAEDAGR